MQISKISYQDQHQYNTKNNQVNFKAFVVGRMAHIRRADALALKRDLTDFLNFHFTYNAVKKAKINYDIPRNEMLFDVAKKLERAERNGLLDNEKAPDIIGHIANLINPKSKAQQLVLKDNHFSIEDFESVIDLLDKKENALLTENLLNIRNETNARLDFSKTLKGILDLNNVQKLNEHIDEFRSYIILHVDESDFVEKLGKELSAERPSFDYKKLDKIIDLKKKRNISPILGFIPEDVLLKGNKEVIDLLSDGYTAQVLNQMSDLTPEDYKFLEYFVSTSNAKNTETRLNFLRKSIVHLQKNQPFEDFRILFEACDANPNIQKIVDLYVNSVTEQQMIPVKKLMFYIDKFGPETITENITGFKSIVNLNPNKNPDEIVSILKDNIRNKYYTTEDERKRVKEYERYNDGFLRKIRNHIKRGFKNLLENLSGPVLPVKTLNETPYADYKLVSPDNKLLTFVEKVPTSAKVEDTSLSTLTHTNKNQLVLTSVEETTSEPVIKETTKRTIAREYKPKNSTISAKKLKIINDAQEIIKSRMKSAKQIEEQAHDYSLTATKMRNKYLNELFNYVADIRKAENKHGKKHHSVSNYDVLELYQKIKGYNEKEFRKMLRARTPEGERMYSFEEINKMLDDSIVEHFRIQREKQAAAKEARRLKKMSLKTN